MTRNLSRLLAVTMTTAFSAAACSELSTGVADTSSLSSAFASVPFGFEQTMNSFTDGATGAGQFWSPASARGPGGGRPGGRGGPGGGGGGLCGGGVGGLFLGGGFGPGFGRGRFGDLSFANCTFEASSGRVVCAAESRNGLTINRSASYRDAAGNVQQAFDSVTTNTINLRVQVAGTVTRRDNSTSTVQHASDRTVSGLAQGSTQRTINGTSAGNETTTGTNATGQFTAVRVIGDTIANVVIPVATTAGTPTYPLSGTVIRGMQVTLTYAGQAPTVSTRREVITYNGSDTASIVITRDGVTQTCSLPLPHGRPSCS